jgi:DNA repair protein RadC
MQSLKRQATFSARVSGICRTMSFAQCGSTASTKSLRWSVYSQAAFRASKSPAHPVRSAICFNAAAVILAHNHPSGNVEPSQANRVLTSRIIEVLGYIGVRVLDHIVVGATSTTSFTERGLF